MSLEEKVARAMCAANSMDADERMPNDGPRWRYYVPCARAAIAVCREEMAQPPTYAVDAALQSADFSVDPRTRKMMKSAIAAAIRSMGERG